jgi:hypothetical protein
MFSCSLGPPTRAVSALILSALRSEGFRVSRPSQPRIMSRPRDVIGPVLGVPLAASCAFALPTEARGMAVHQPEAGVLLRVLMPLRTVSLLAVDVRGPSLRVGVANVLLMRAEKQVRGIHAAPVVAPVADARSVESFAERDGAEGKLPRHPMRGDGTAFPLECAVPARAASRDPLPARGSDRNLLPEAFSKVARHGMNITPSPIDSYFRKVAW